MLVNKGIQIFLVHYVDDRDKKRLLYKGLPVFEIICSRFSQLAAAS